MTLLPMNRMHDELKKVDQYRKKKSQSFIFVEQDVDWFEQEEKNMRLSLRLAEARINPIDINIKIIEVDHIGTSIQK